SSDNLRPFTLCRPRFTLPARVMCVPARHRPDAAAGAGFHAGSTFMQAAPGPQLPVKPSLSSVRATHTLAAAPGPAAFLLAYLWPRRQQVIALAVLLLGGIAVQ